MAKLYNMPSPGVKAPETKVDISLEGLIKDLKAKHQGKEVYNWFWFEDCAGNEVTVRLSFRKQEGIKK